MLKRTYFYLLLSIVFMLFTGGSCGETDPPVDPNVYGCIDRNACNFVETATVDDESCLYTIDCRGLCGGSAIMDICNICEGDGSLCQDCTGAPNGTAVIDCTGICDGGNAIDECGICSGDNSTCSDCAGDANGTAEEDCSGACAGNLVIDDCGVCGGDNDCECPGFSEGTLKDCNGDCGGTAKIDDCGVCDGDNMTCSDCTGAPNGSASEDCSGTCNGPKVIDECNVCGGDNTTCVDCMGTANGSADKDCNNVCQGTATIDECGMCSGGDTGLETNASCTDCSGVVNGTAFYDPCGNCTLGNVSWKIQVLTKFLPNNDAIHNSLIFDEENYLGADPAAVDGYDIDLDVIEPPIGTTNWVSFYFRHQDWEDAVIGGQQYWKFTEDIRNNDYDQYSSEGKLWEAEIDGSFGMAGLEFIYSEILTSATITVTVDGIMYEIENGSNIENILLMSGSPKNVDIRVSDLCY